MGYGAVERTIFALFAIVAVALLVCLAAEALLLSSLDKEAARPRHWMQPTQRSVRGRISMATSASGCPNEGPSQYTAAVWGR